MYIHRIIALHRNGVYPGFGDHIGVLPQVDYWIIGLDNNFGLDGFRYMFVFILDNTMTEWSYGNGRKIEHRYFTAVT